MASSFAIAGIAFFTLGVIGTFAWNIFYPRFLGRVQGDAKTWVQLGQPKIRWYGYKPTKAFLIYLNSRSYETLADATAIKLGRQVRAAFMLTIMATSCAVVLLGLASWLCG